MVAAGVLGVALAAAGCSGGDAATKSAGATPSASAGSSPVTAASSAAPADDGDDGEQGGAGSEQSGEQGESGSGGETAGCTASDLKITDEAAAGGGSAGHHSEYLIFENVTGKACSLEGYPGVSFVTGDSGKQVGKAFARAGGDTPLIMLTPGDRVHATIQIADPRNVDAGDCKPVEVRGYRIYPPDETAAVFVSKPQTACSAGDEAVGQVKPIAPRTSDS
nr:DUF4232 domain-containing protein [Actinoplanes lichenis]